LYATVFGIPQTQSEEPIPVKLNEIDQTFLNKLTQLMEKELSNSGLNINSISRELGFSRAGFYRKVKGLMDISPLDFLRNYRLRRAAEMIREGALSLNEVAEKTGFGTYSYFSVAFKKHYNISPKDYRQK
jgi:AraC-like DNA-binding protein